MASIDKSVCVIGGGVSGIVMAKTLLQYEIDFDLFDDRRELGGIWNYDSDPTVASVYQHCRLNHYRESMAYLDCPIDESLPTYLSNSEFLGYLQSYAAKNAISRYCTLSSKVISVEHDGKLYLVKVKNLVDGVVTEKKYRHIIVCTGKYNCNKQFSTFDAFKGDLVYSSRYKTPESYKDKVVCVFGMGSSSVQIASELVGHARKVFLLCRDTSYIIPKYIFGLPAFKFYSKFISSLPRFIQRWYFSLILYIVNGPMRHHKKYPNPSHKLLSGRLPLSGIFLEQVENEEIVVLKTDHYRVSQNGIELNGSIVSLDSIIICGGFDYDVSFMEGFDVDFQRNFKYMLNIDNPGLFFVGAVQPIGPVPPLVHMQAIWICKYLSGNIKLPDKGKIECWLQNNKRRVIKRYGKLSGYYSRIGFREYINMLENDM